MAGKQGGEEPKADDFDFYLAEDLVELDIDFGSEAKTEDDLTPQPAPRVDTRPTADRSHPSAVERGVVGKQMTAMEALAAAMRVEEEKEEEKRRKIESAQRDIQRQKKAELARKIAQDAARRVQAERREQEEREAAEEAEWARAAFSGKRAPVSVAGLAQRAAAQDELEGLPKGAVVERIYTEIPAAVIGSLMAAHKVRAAQGNDLAAAVAFAAIEGAIGGGAARAARVSFGGKEWAVWMDKAGIVAVVEPAALYLAGL